MYFIDNVNLYSFIFLPFSIFFTGVFYKNPFTFGTGFEREPVFIKKTLAKKVEKVKMTFVEINFIEYNTKNHLKI